MPLIEQRNLNGLQKPLLKKINCILNKEEHVRRASKVRKFLRSGNRERRRICLNRCKTKAEIDRLKKQQQRCESSGKNTSCYVMIVTKHRLDIITVVSFVMTFLTYCFKKTFLNLCLTVIFIIKNDKTLRKIKFLKTAYISINSSYFSLFVLFD